MAHKQYSSTFTMSDILHLSNSLFLKLCITNSQHLIHYKNFGIKVGCHSKAETNLHTAAIALHWRINITFTSRKSDDLIQLASYFLLGHTQNGAIHIDVFKSRHLRMETRTDFKQRANTSSCLDGSQGGSCNSRQEFKQSTFPGTILTDDTYNVTLLNLKVNVPQRPNIFTVGFLGTIVYRSYCQIRIFFTKYAHCPPTFQVVAQSSSRNQSQTVLLTDMVKFYRYRHNNLY